MASFVTHDNGGTIPHDDENGNKHVHFADGTAGGRETVLAISISRYDHLENLGYTEYTIQVRTGADV